MKTDISAAKPTNEEMLRVLEKMTWHELLDFKDKFEELVQKIREKKVQEKYDRNRY